ncbi:MAG: hypothetical protein JXB85_05190 [Anaerolineales bacterium]|nr:hypothetical protein [Anaerolineales bacterium]
MNDTLLIASQRSPVLVSRSRELERIQAAIYRPQKPCEVIFMRGEGGLGKSRLAEETLWRGGNWRMRRARGEPAADWDWTRIGPAVVGDLLDMTDSRLHTRAQFMRAVRDALVWEGNGIGFNGYDAAYSRYQRLRNLAGDYKAIQEAEEQAEQKFLVDYSRNASSQRLVLILDTVERLLPVGTQWLMEKGLVHPQDVIFYTFQWLAEQVRQNRFPNTTLILVGRGQQGRPFFEHLSGATQAAGKECLGDDIDLAPFDDQDTQAYFEALADYWEGQAESTPAYAQISRELLALAGDQDRTRTLRLYTGGKPVHLALYADLILEGRSIPQPLQDSYVQALERVGANPQGEADPQKLAQAQFMIEEEFVRLLFGPPSLRSEILKVLVRAPRGLNAEQLHFVMSSAGGEAACDWLEKKGRDQKQAEIGEQIQNEMETLRHLSIIKVRPDGRLGLQDEIYRIYAAHLSKDERNRSGEQKERQLLYRKLQAWAQYQTDQRMLERSAFLDEDERNLRLTRPAEALEIRFSTLTDREEERRSAVRTALSAWEVESLHYGFLIDLRRNINHVLFEVGDRRWLANDEESEGQLQMELWLVLKDEASMRFVTPEPWFAVEERHEEPYEALVRVAQQDDVTRWIKRFVMRKQYQRAIEFCEAVEKVAARMTTETERHSWMHTFARGERQCWKGYAEIFLGQRTLEALAEMEAIAADLEVLLRYREEEWAFEDRNEKGFLGHPGETRLRRVAALLHNFIGYGYSTLGMFKKAKRAYGMALRYMRQTEFPAQQATTRNNLSRVLSERGYTRARRVCLDALALRRSQGADVPIAYSLNTLALIDNDHNRPDLAWAEAAAAAAYFRRVDDPRGLGLALLQLGEALRRHGKPESNMYHPFREDSPEVILNIAARADSEAMELFTTSPAAGEKMRLVEAWIEMGCLQRDRMKVARAEDEQRQRFYRDALYYLNQAGALARELNNKRLDLDARVNTAWTHFLFDEFEQAEEILQQAEELLPEDCWIRKGQPFPEPGRDDLYVYAQLSKMYGLRGRMGMERFMRFTRLVAKENPGEALEVVAARRMRVHQDKTAQAALAAAAENYVLALAYAQLLSPRSSALGIVYDSLYHYLKKFNLVEMDDFYRYENRARKRFAISRIKLEDLGNLDEFLEDCFGRGLERR